MLFLVGHRYDFEDPDLFEVDAVVTAETPEEALEKFERTGENGYYMGELNLVGGCVWEAREPRQLIG